MDKIEDRTICAQCGGYCCKKSGCDYFVSDLEKHTLEYIESLLDTGRVSIVAALNFERLPNGKLASEPHLYLRARNVNRGEIDLLSFKTTCASLEEAGCHYQLEERPSGGATYIPRMTNNQADCYTEIDRLEELKKWDRYQKVLRKIVQRRTGKGVYNKLKEDVENLFYDLFMGNTDGVMEAELYDVIKMSTMCLIEAYPEEYKSAKKKSDASPIVKKKSLSTF